MRRGAVVGVVGALLLAGVVLAVGPLLLDRVRAWWSGPAASVAMRVEPAQSSALPAPSVAALPPPPPSAKRERYRRFQSEPAVLASARREADAVRAQLERALAARDAGARPPREESARHDADFPATPAPAASNDPVAQARRRALQRTVKEEFIPLAASCYQTLLAKRPDAAGKLVLNMTIVGDRAIGGVVESVEIAPDSTLKDEELTTCIRESMLAVQFDPPPTDGGRVTITYPFDFAP